MPETEPSARLGRYILKQFQGETVRAFVPPPLPPAPPVDLARFQILLEQANQAIGRLDGLASLLALCANTARYSSDQQNLPEPCSSITAFGLRSFLSVSRYAGGELSRLCQIANAPTEREGLFPVELDEIPAWMRTQWKSWERRSMAWSERGSRRLARM